MSYQQQQDLITTSSTSTVDYYQDPAGDLYLKYFLIDSSFNNRGWSVDSSQLRRIAKEAIGKPFTDYEDFPETVFRDGHPWSPKQNATFKDHVLYAMENATGIIVDFSPVSRNALKSASGSEIQQNNGYYVTVKVLKDDKKQKYLQNPERIPKVSPGIFDYDLTKLPANNLKNIDLIHLAGVKSGAYGDKARLYATCQGGYECVNHLKGASDSIEKNDGIYNQLFNDISNAVGAEWSVNYNSSLGETSQNNTSDNIMVDNPSNPSTNNSTIDNGNAVATIQNQQPQQQEIPQQSQIQQQEVTNNNNSKEQQNNATNNPTNNQITGNPIERLKSKYIYESSNNNNNNKQGQTNFKEDPDYKKLLLEHEELKKKVDLEDKRRFYAELIPKEVFIINGKFNQEGYNKEIEKAIDKNLDPDLAKEYYNLKLNNIRLNNKIGKPYGAGSSFAVDLSGTNSNPNTTRVNTQSQSYRTPDSVPEVKGASDIHSSQFQSIINIRKMFGSLNNAGGSV